MCTFCDIRAMERREREQAQKQSESAPTTGPKGGMFVLKKVIGNATLYCCDYQEVLNSLNFDFVVTDPPYGVSMNRGDSKIQGEIAGDSAPPNIAWMAKYPAVVWGGNNFCDQLPRSTGWFVWFKHFPEGSRHSQAEIAWTNTSKTVRHYAEAYHGFMRQRDGWFHPTQKPPKLMEWCLMRSKVPEGAVVFDPYMGSGTTGIACVSTGRKFIGCEIDKKYFDIACKRIEEAQA